MAAFVAVKVYVLPVTSSVPNNSAVPVATCLCQCGSRLDGWTSYLHLCVLSHTHLKPPFRLLAQVISTRLDLVYFFRLFQPQSRKRHHTILKSARDRAREQGRMDHVVAECLAKLAKLYGVHQLERSYLPRQTHCPLLFNEAATLHRASSEYDNGATESVGTRRNSCYTEVKERPSTNTACLDACDTSGFYQVYVGTIKS